jgi:hypothetical protein
MPAEPVLGAIEGSGRTGHQNWGRRRQNKRFFFANLALKLTCLTSGLFHRPFSSPPPPEQLCVFLHEFKRPLQTYVFFPCFYWRYSDKTDGWNGKGVQRRPFLPAVSAYVSIRKNVRLTGKLLCWTQLCGPKRWENVGKRAGLFVEMIWFIAGAKASEHYVVYYVNAFAARGPRRTVVAQHC